MIHPDLKSLFDFIADGAAPAALQDFILAHPDLDLDGDVSDDGDEGWSAFAEIICRGDLAVVDVFLSHAPDRVAVNHVCAGGCTAIMSLISNPEEGDSDAIFRRLLAHPLVSLDFAVRTNFILYGWVAFACAACRSLRNMKLLVASGKPLGWSPGDLLPNNASIAPLPLRDVMIRSPFSNKIPDLQQRLESLDCFVADPDLARHSARLEFAAEHRLVVSTFDALCLPALALDLFAAVVFVCDGLLRLRDFENLTDSAGHSRLVALVSRLPLELQMVLCHRVAGSARLIILTADSDPAFRHLAHHFSC